MVDNEWVYGQYLEFSNPNEPSGWIVITDHEEHPELSGNPIEDLTHCIPVFPETVGQFAGLRDKNGKEIYEGDLFLFSGFIQNTVIFERGMFCYNPSPEGDDLYDIVPLSNSNFGWENGRSNTIEVIGNIHENQEDDQTSS